MAFIQPKEAILLSSKLTYLASSSIPWLPKAV
jgi:hypothetical protein